MYTIIKVKEIDIRTFVLLFLENSLWW